LRIGGTDPDEGTPNNGVKGAIDDVTNSVPYHLVEEARGLQEEGRNDL